MFTVKERYKFEDFRELIALLRSPEGCPWDRQQTHESIRRNFIEETYEVCDAIDKQDTALMREELGDVMLQILLHADMEEKAGHFDVDDVIDEVCKKLVIRHPHIFTELEVHDSEEVLDNWDRIKMQTKGQKTNGASVQDVPKCLPALMRGKKVLKRASKSGLLPTDTAGEMGYLCRMLQMSPQGENVNKEAFFGEVLLRLTNIMRNLSVDGEESLTKATNTFINRFINVEADILKNENGSDAYTEENKLNLLCMH